MKINTFKPITGAKRISMSPEQKNVTIICKSLINAGKQSPAKIFYFFSNLDRYYLKISPGHKKFTILDSLRLAEGVRISVEETAGNQYVKHNYVVEKVIPDKQISLISDPSEVSIGHIFKVHIITKVEFNIATSLNGDTILSSTLTLQFKSSVSRIAAKLLGVKTIWEKHLLEEMANGLSIIQSQEFIDDFNQSRK